MDSLPISYDLSTGSCLLLLQAAVTIAYYSRVVTYDFPVTKGMCSLSYNYGTYLSGNSPKSVMGGPYSNHTAPNNEVDATYYCAIYGNISYLEDDSTRKYRYGGPVAYMSEMVEDNYAAIQMCHKRIGTKRPCCQLRGEDNDAAPTANSYFYCNEWSLIAHSAGRLARVIGFTDVFFVVLLQLFLGWASKGRGLRIKRGPRNCVYGGLLNCVAVFTLVACLGMLVGLAYGATTSFIVSIVAAQLCAGTQFCVMCFILCSAWFSRGAAPDPYFEIQYPEMRNQQVAEWGAFD